MGLPLSPLELACSALACALSLALFLARPRTGTARLPGPRGLPVVGNALQIPAHQQWLRFAQWTRIYGDAFALDIMGQHTIVLGSAEAAFELLDARGAIYSDRPTAVMAGELAGWDAGLGYARGPHQARFRALRRLFQQAIGPRACGAPPLVRAQEDASRALLARLLGSPERFGAHLRDATGAFILRLTYGYAAKAEDDPLVRVVEDAMAGFAAASEPGAFWVDHFPILKHVPTWVPGAGFRRTAARFDADRQRMYDAPFAHTQAQLAAGDAEPSFVARFLEEGVDEELIKAAAASLYSGGAETTPASTATFLLAMALYPEVQTRAQAEVDSVLRTDPARGPPRLPRAYDRAQMPYVCALLREVYRWQPAVPLGLPHAAARADVFRGCAVPAGAVVWANVWGMLHDPRHFPEPDAFRPERYLEVQAGGGWRARALAPAEDPLRLAFGFGRRVCPGLALADGALFLALAGILATLRVCKARDEQGAEVEPRVWYDGFIAHPAPFECVIEPRWPEVERLVGGQATEL